MNNTRYSFFVAGGIAGLLSAVILLVNAAKRAGIIPVTDLTQLLAPLAQLSAIVFFLIILARVTGARAVAVIANIVTLAALVGVEFVINLVFAQVDPQTIATLREGPLGLALTVSSIAFLLVSLWLATALWNRLGVGVIVYAVGTIPVALRSFVPEIVLDLGLVAMAIGVAAMSIRMLRGRVTESTRMVTAS